MILAPALMVVVAFTFATAIFHTLLGAERRIWPLAMGRGDLESVTEADIRFAHRVLKHLSGWLPASNGIVILVGLPGLVWQGFLMSWSLAPSAVLGFWIAGQLWILTVGRIAGLVSDLRTCDSDGPLVALVPVLRGLVRQHFNGLLHAGGTLALQIILIVWSGI